MVVQYTRSDLNTGSQLAAAVDDIFFTAFQILCLGRCFLMATGLVSNCCQVQLSSGHALDEVIAEAERRELRVVELRQGCLGTYESGDAGIPDAHRLSELPNRFPRMSFNIAMSVPFLSSIGSVSASMLESGRRAAVAVAGSGQPHLRLVDLESPFDINYELAQRNLVALARSMETIDGLLSIEHSFQQWSGLLHAFRSARSSLDSQKKRLRLCFDPCNLQMAEPGIDVAAAVASLLVEEISMVHLKQCRDGSILPNVSDGELNWKIAGKALADIGYCGTSLFEVASSSDVWGQLENSRKYLEKIGLVLSADS
jgi:sugar phosphate isomerase/epimerase